MSLCVGIDLSTKRIDLAAVPLDPDVPGGPWHASCDRIRDEQLVVFANRAIEEALRRVRFCNGVDAALTVNGQATAQDISHSVQLAQADIATTCIEKPAGRHVHPSMWLLYGAIGSNALHHCTTVTGLYPVEWRQAIGLEGRDKNNKAAGNARVRDLYPSCHDWDEHALDALGIATAWRTIQWKAAA